PAWCSWAKSSLEDGQLASDLQDHLAFLVLAAQEELHHARLSRLSECGEAGIVVGLREHRALREQGVPGEHRSEVAAFVVGEVGERVLLRLLRGEAGDEGEDDPAVDHAPAVERHLWLVVAHLLVEVQLRRIEHEVRPEHVLVGDGAAARVHDRLAHREVLVEVVVAREAVALGHGQPSSSRLAITSYWISLVPSKMRNTRASRQNLWAGNSRE